MRNDFESNYLMHWGLKKGAKAPNHKYYERVEKNGKYLYFYTQAEYEAWLHQGNSALESAKNKGKELLDKAKNKVNQLTKDSNSRQTLANTKQNLVNAVNTGYSQTTNLLAMAQKQLTKSNAQAVLDRGNKAISSMIGSSQPKQSTPKESIVSKAAKKVKDFIDYDITGKGYSRDFWNDNSRSQRYKEAIKRGDLHEMRVIENESNRAHETARANERRALIPRIKQAAEDFQENVAYTVSTGERKIAQMLRNTKDNAINALEKNANERDHYYSMNTSLEKASNSYGAVGSNIITTILATAAAAVVFTAAKVAIQTFGPKIVEKTKEIMDKIFNPEVKVSVETETKPIETKPTENKTIEDRPKDFATDCPSSYKEDRAAHSDIPQKDTPTSRDEDMEAVNPNFKEMSEVDYAQVQMYVNTYQALIAAGDYEAADRILEKYFEIYGQYEGYLQNCANCTLTYDMRRRGYDVTASWNPNATNMESIADWYKLKDEDILGYESNYRLSKNEIRELEKSIIKQYPEGSYGHLMLSWVDGGGHDVVWSIEGGKVVIRDCQSNQVLNFEDYAKEANAFTMFRTDDKELSDKAYAICTAEKATIDGEPDEDTGYDDPYNNFVRTDDNKVKDVQDFAYDYRKQNKAAGRKKRK